MPPAPTVYRPPQKPAPAAKKNMGPLIGLITAGVLALVGFAVAGLMWSGKSAAEAKVLQLQDSASALASALGVSLSADTNTPVDWSTAWAVMDKAASDQKRELADSKAQAAALEQQVTELQTANTELTEVKTRADQQAAQLKRTADELAALKTSSAAKITTLEQELEGAKQALADAQAAAEAAAAQAAQAGDTMATPPAATEGMSEASAPADTAMPAESTDPSAVAAGAAAAGAAAMADDKAAPESGVSMEAPAQDGQFNFPEKNATLKNATYDAAGQILKITLANNTELVYRAVPYEIYDGLVNAPVHEVYFRMKVVGNFPVDPDDKAALRDLRYR